MIVCFKQWHRFVPMWATAHREFGLLIWLKCRSRAVMQLTSMILVYWYSPAFIEIEEKYSERYQESGLNRSELPAENKSRTRSYIAILVTRAFEGSMGAWDLNYLDLFEIHWLNAAVFKDEWKQVSRSTWRAPTPKEKDCPFHQLSNAQLRG